MYNGLFFFKKKLRFFLTKTFLSGLWSKVLVRDEAYNQYMTEQSRKADPPLPGEVGWVLLSFDLETTGRQVPTPSSKFQCSAVCEVGAVAWFLPSDGGGGGREVGRFQAYCRPRVPVDRDAAAVTGLTTEFLQKSRPFPHVFTSLVEFWSGVRARFAGSTFVLLSYRGHLFDLPILLHDLRLCGEPDAVAQLSLLCLDFSLDGQALLRARALDAGLTLDVAKHGPNLVLGSVHQAVLRRPLVGAHGAVADSEAVLHILTHPGPALGILRSALAAGPDRAPWALADVSRWASAEMKRAQGLRASGGKRSGRDLRSLLINKRKTT